MTQMLIVMLTTVPDQAAADALIAPVLEARLAACATCLGEARSTYRWQGKIERSAEIPILFKTSALQADALEQWIASHHPYDVPEILRWDATAAPAYAQWALAETQTEKP